MTAKEEIREQLLSHRNEIDPNTIGEKSRQIAFHLYQLDEFLDAEKVHVFTSYGSEPDTSAIREYALHLKKIVYVPVIERERREFHNVQVDPNMKYEPGLFGIPNPVFKNGAMKFVEKPELHLTEKDIVIIPLLAFDGKLHRLGYGHGYYDRFLNRNPAFKIGIAFDVQRIEEIPVEEFDIPLDMIITESDVIRAVPLPSDQTEEVEARRARAYDYAHNEPHRAYEIPEEENVQTEEVLKTENDEPEIAEENTTAMQEDVKAEIPQENAEQQIASEAPRAKKVIVFGDDDIPGMPKRDDE